MLSRDLPDVTAGAAWYDSGLEAGSVNMGEENGEDGDDVAALLQRARRLVENAHPSESASLEVFPCAGNCRAWGKQQQAGEERWKRLRYLEWLMQFLVRQEGVRKVLQHHAAESWQLAQVPATGPTEAFNEALASARGGVDTGETTGSRSSCIDSVTVTYLETNRLHGPCSEAVPHFESPQTLMPNEGVHALEAHANHAENNILRAVASACDDAQEVIGTTSDEIDFAQQPELQEKKKEWRFFRTWYPPELSLLANVPQSHGTEASPTPHILCLSTVVHEKPRGMRAKEEALVAQGHYCKSCLGPLKKSYFPIPSWKAARFCHYMGMYYCHNCHSRRKSVIPARILHFWDTRCFSVCNDAFGFLELQTERPLYCVSAVNPRLYEHSVLLNELRYLRIQVMALREVGVQCSVFRRLFYREDGTKKSTTGDHSQKSSSLLSDTMVGKFEMGCFVPREKRYLMEDSEVWSLDDLLEVHRCCSGGLNHDDASWDVPLQVRAGGHVHPVMDCRVFMYLRRLRMQMTSHIFRRRCDVCLRNSLDICRWCCPSGMLDVFRRYRMQGVLHHQQGVEGSPTLCPVFPPPPVDQATSLHEHAELFLFVVHSFDLLHVRSCPQCGACYHKQCFELMQCGLAGGMGCLRCRGSSDITAFANVSEHLLSVYKGQLQPECLREGEPM
ncbi:pleckstrin homology domain-containing family M member 3 isoform X2 [Trypanosoma rangeli]|uniref:Pleckstrin homology domain-containing family M member 3 isoform X2 n=1 Tax=Trypanosoma rangeli TaxID=5698 RepID=A0A422NQI6_TRYRA|nr:pleckstrin homology domain-containing family M member 3 isoform X2 [Trypanosoma rangeli]RNF07733.1 pleckstrin homology domain-containing family M member 3 isoform X2 [Trypanosoma rangeli]|eukprot:RNF07733.1 pleckstrin homology domain-containing family M member 3 isoform X2 [Trypanosoma rangeli]